MAWPIHAVWWHRSGSTLAQVMACCQQAITWTKVDFSLVRFNGIPLAQSQLMLKLLLCTMSLKIIPLKLLPHVAGVKEYAWIWYQISLWNKIARWKVILSYCKSIFLNQFDYILNINDNNNDDDNDNSNNNNDNNNNNNYYYYYYYYNDLDGHHRNNYDDDDDDDIMIIIMIIIIITIMGCSDD